MACQGRSKGVLEFLTLYEFIVATLMALAALCVFLWAAATGLLQNVEAVKYQVLQVEEDPRRGREEEEERRHD